MKKIIAVIVLLFVLVGAWWFASPWWALKGMKDAGMHVMRRRLASISIFLRCGRM